MLSTKITQRRSLETHCAVCPQDRVNPARPELRAPLFPSGEAATLALRSPTHCQQARRAAACTGSAREPSTGPARRLPQPFAGRHLCPRWVSGTGFPLASAVCPPPAAPMFTGFSEGQAPADCALSHRVLFLSCHIRPHGFKQDLSAGGPQTPAPGAPPAQAPRFSYPPTRADLMATPALQTHSRFPRVSGDDDCSTRPPEAT